MLAHSVAATLGPHQAVGEILAAVGRADPGAPDEHTTNPRKKPKPRKINALKNANRRN